MKKLILILLAIILLSGCTAWNSHMYGYDKAIKFDIEPLEYPLYYSIEGIEDKVYFDMPTVQARARLLADIIGYVESDIACSADGVYLYTGVE